MKDPKILYILISIFCVFAIIAGIYAQFIEGGSKPHTNTSSDVQGATEKDMETVKAQLSDLFTNTVNLNEYDTTGIKRLNEEKEIVYTAFDINKSEETYEINIKIPAFNISNGVTSSFNQITQTNFVNKASEVLAHNDPAKKIIYSIEYAGFVNGDILSVIIKSTLKEGDSAQRVIIQTYNYNLATGEEVSLTDLITNKSLNKEEVNQTIKKVVQEADAEARAVQSMGYNNIYSRDLEDTRYSVEESSTYFLGPNNNLYIIYPYGNKDFTSEMDVVLFE